MDQGVKRSATTSSTSRRPRVAGVFALVFGALTTIVAIPSLVAAGTDPGFLFAGLVALVVAAVSFLFAGLAFRFVREPSTTLTAMTPLLWLVAAALFVGVLGSMGAFVYGQVVQNQQSAAVGLLLLPLAGGVMITGAVLVGAVVRARRAAAAGR
ncbi:MULTISPECIES: hypothetical protein [Microbacterium]|uniref:hypothetical protein n=1 Tax=Microbacterium TaxID=33882 RepID=UPI0021A3C0FC|nr:MULTISPECIES: hypothetical protein [Microbacterium]MCT1364213.1 hypothetical protein [Microbacterium sp. p3-SID131]MCT1375750.1 hypothetical protein [Microbacterium sp. p3-SID337]MCZ0711255.1 hypothetical protein [Microbacterium paraoxydans]MDH5131890.1 hypothetical protein [Microbacterium sp. RD10]MDH5135847.1 hypothetical protein [Microbacterium sp. RD11]